MDERQTVAIDFFDQISLSAHSDHETKLRVMTYVMHPDDVVDDFQLTQAEKREILASWASDMRAVQNAPALRQLDNGAVVRVADVLRALQLLDDCEDSKAPATASFKPDVAVNPFGRWRPHDRSSQSGDDDDPSSCPATISGPLRGPLTGGEAADLNLMLAG
jgi:hypothetical protein